MIPHAAKGYEISSTRLLGSSGPNLPPNTRATYLDLSSADLQTQGLQCSFVPLHAATHYLGIYLTSMCQ